MLEATTVSERRACRLAGLSRDAFRHPPEQAPATQALLARIIELAQVRRRFGYRRLHDLLRPEYPAVNHKKVYRLYRDANLAVRRRKKVRRPPRGSPPFSRTLTRRPMQALRSVHVEAKEVQCGVQARCC